MRLRADRARWAVGETPTFTLDMRNQGTRNLGAMPAPETGRLEVDGTWHTWMSGGVSVPSPFPLGRAYEGLVVPLGEGWGVKLAPGKHKIRFANDFRDVPSTDLPRGSVIPGPTVSSNAVEIEILASNGAPAAAVARWGTPVKDVAASLHTDHFAWTADDAVTFSGSVRNRGNLDLAIQKLSELEVDGVWYHWAKATGANDSAWLRSGSQVDDIRVALASDWRTKEGQLLHLTPGRHVVRFAPQAGTVNSFAAISWVVAVVSNPVEIDVEPGIASRAALVKKYLPGCELLAVRKLTAGQESMDEILKTPDGREVDLASLRQSWAGTPADQDVDTWINPKLAALLPSLKIKIETATLEGAKDVTRIIFGVFKDRGGYDECDLKVAKRHGDDWLVCHDGPSFATIELIMADGILQDARVCLPRGPAKQSDATLKSDPVAAIRAALPKGWAIHKVEESAYPSMRKAAGKAGKAIYLHLPGQKVGVMQDEDSVVYIMPADYDDGGDNPADNEAQKFPAALILSTSAAKVYLLGNESSSSATGWPTLKDDILKAILQ
jgi:hypothetical protein